ncbi:hypothetical protein [Streptomyces sp. R41]|uniref:Uncharacterized protein n=1 Tax=Streptomyces sp. R41 TaxID=3238632 RepID=A0AB39R7G0_9ACTN
MPGKVADFLHAAEPDDTEQTALDHGVTVRRGQGHTPRVSTTTAVHRQLLARCQPLDGSPAIPAQRKDVPLPHSTGILLQRRCGCTCHAYSTRVMTRSTGSGR